MPGQICAVASCKSNRLTLKKEGVKLVFHSFPKTNESIKKEWIKRCNRNNKFNPLTASICSLHFKPDDYERDLQNELLGLPLRRVLKKATIPTLNLNVISEKIEEDDTPRAKRVYKKRKKVLVKKNHKNLEPPELLDIPSTSSDDNERDLQNELQGLPLRRVLKKSTIPTLNLKVISEKIEEDDTPRPKRVQKKRKKDLVKSLVKTNHRNVERPQLIDNPSTSSNTDTYKQKYENLLLMYNLLKSKSSKKINELNKMVKYYKAKCRPNNKNIK